MRAPWAGLGESTPLTKTLLGDDAGWEGFAVGAVNSSGAEGSRIQQDEGYDCSGPTYSRFPRVVLFLNVSGRGGSCIFRPASVDELRSLAKDRRN